MSSKVHGAAHGGRVLACLTVLALSGLAASVLARPATGEEPPAPPAAASFATPEAAAKALVEAAEKNDDAALKSIFGPDGEDLVQAGTDIAVRAERASFVTAAKEKLVLERPDDATAVLVVGEDEWPFPVPLVKGEDGAWRFDAAAGREEILARRIGRNEIEAIGICKAYAAAQVEYAAADRDGDGVREYAQRILSAPGQKDGLYWPTPEGSEEEQSPLGPYVASLEQHLAGIDKTAPFNGYYWRILTAQGPSAPGGAYSYVINGNMIAGFALVGVPADYMKTGVMTFLVSNHGQVLQKDLGEKSVELVKAMTAFDPDGTWKDVTDEVND